ncbi:coproporphyrinogen III oxidase [bacterium BMS3Bbin05]|nr:coproporphyrinogen III oxidase [bacterium BMS3Bbin05]HDL21282.1 radical SAM protein [Nitrospirota bacterium]
MKCALIIPSWLPEEIFPTKTAASQVNYWQPLGTLYVASSLMRAGHKVRFLNGAFMAHDKIIREVGDFNPGFVGIYSTTFGWKKAVQTAKDIRGALKDVFIATGGPHPIAMQEKCLRDTDSINAVVTGEGEVTVVEMIGRLSDGKSLDGVEGVIYREKDEIFINPQRALITDIDSLPFPARELLGDSGRYIPPPATYKRKPVAVIMTARGCNRRCIFCFQIDKERKSGIRYRSVGNVMEEIELCLHQKYREIKFIDDTFAADYGRAMEIALEIKRRKLDFTWFASACVHQVDRPLLRAFRDAGCWAILMGAESGVQKDLNTLRKGITIDQTRNAVKAAREVGIKVFAPFLFGIPGQTYEDALKSIEFACELDPDVANFHALTPFPGTELYDNIGKYGRMSEDTTDFTYQGAAFIPYSMTREQIGELRQVAFRRFYSRPRFMLKRILGLRSVNDLIAVFRGMRSLFWMWVKKDIFRGNPHEPWAHRGE